MDHSYNDECMMMGITEAAYDVEVSGGPELLGISSAPIKLGDGAPDLGGGSGTQQGQTHTESMANTATASGSGDGKTRFACWINFDEI